MARPAVRRRAAKPRAGRPTVADARRLEAAILEQATASFLRNGYAATSIEAIAKSCSVAKRTIYARWSGKPALFRASVERLVAQWLALSGEWEAAPTLEDALRQAADRIMAVALTPEAIALYRLLVAESARFPELPRMMQEAGAHSGVARIAALLQAAVARGECPSHDTVFASEQYMHLLLAGPQRRALGLGPAMGSAEGTVWRDNTIRLFLGGLNSLRLPSPPKQ
ncbi:MAG TPA: TetR/AcrR family transcriptional regulator [Rhodopila sp.]|uniref:TetR/AcrR family transcriptional regulator n=1 Tax=Rhodopila sp. TaxID=2480087 RepID=UPI002CC50E37|nr:TetR/AcrR family transcriptional regulator [Rhodopila sp.]HVY17042.1 TetR/AcrR family transcriptional regulator [Rhodopila sp.]